MAAVGINLPPGFQLEPDLPPGFVLDKKYASASDDPNQVGLFKGLRSAADLMDKASYGAGDWVSEKAHNLGASPEIAGGLGYGTNVALQSLPMAFGGGAGKAALTPAMQSGAESLMQSALKPTIKQLKTGDADVAIKTMLEQGYNATKGGVESMRSKIDALNEQIKSAIAASPETINKGEIGKTLQGTYDKFKSQVNPQADLDAIKKSWMEFRGHPALAGKTEIPLQLAQELKQGTYKQLAKKYGEMGSADIESQKALARALKEGIAEKVPGVAGLNAEETALIKTLSVAERRSLMETNKNPLGLALLTQNPGALVAFMADKSALFKSVLARMLHSTSESIPASAGRAAFAGAPVANRELQ